MSKQIRHPSIESKLVWSKGIKHLKKNDKVIAKLIKDIKIDQRKLNDDYLEAIVRSIIYQQISGKAGSAIIGKFKMLYKGKIPLPKQFLDTPENKVRKAGISPQKYSYLKDLCERIESGALELKKFKHMESEKIIQELDEVRGIGRWTAEMFLISSLGRTDVIPADDLGIKKGIQKAYKLRKLPEKEKIMKLSKNWQPYGTIASIYIWRSLDTK
jgi:DNA-3-methyladenine glycosylase II